MRSSMKKRTTNPSKSLDHKTENLINALREALNNIDECYLMLSSGIDSQLIAAILSSMNTRVHAVTIGGLGNISDDLPKARMLSQYLGMPHHVIHPKECVQYTEEMVTALGASDVWEIAAALPQYAVRKFMDDKSIPYDMPIISGHGADLLIAGEHKEPLTIKELSKHRSENLKYVNQEEYPNPDFPTKVFGPRMNAYLEPFLHKNVIEVTKDLTPDDLWITEKTHNGDEKTFNKVVAREAFAKMTGLYDLAWTSKSPLQESSGIFDCLYSEAVRQATKTSLGYRNPEDEAPKLVATRIYLQSLHVQD